MNALPAAGVPAIICGVLCEIGCDRPQADEEVKAEYLELFGQRTLCAINFSRDGGFDTESALCEMGCLVLSAGCRARIGLRLHF